MQYQMARGRTGMVAGLLAATSLGPAAAASEYEIDIVFHGSLDLPRVNMLILDEDGEPYTGSNWLDDLFGDIGEDFGDWFDESSFAFVPGFYDTGASGMVLAQGQAEDMGLPLDPNVVFEDIGVGGTVEFAVSQPLDLRVAPPQRDAARRRGRDGRARTTACCWTAFSA